MVCFRNQRDVCYRLYVESSRFLVFGSQRFIRNECRFAKRVCRWDPAAAALIRLKVIGLCSVEVLWQKESRCRLFSFSREWALVSALMTVRALMIAPHSLIYSCCVVGRPLDFLIVISCCVWRAEELNRTWFILDHWPHTQALHCFTF